MVMVQRLSPLLPENFTAEPHVHLGAYFEIDGCTYEDEEAKTSLNDAKHVSEGGIASTWAPPEPTLTVDVDLEDEFAYEVLVYDQSRARQLVAAVEIVSPANKDRPRNRKAFITKCAALVQLGVCVSIVDLVTNRNFNLYSELLVLFDRTDPAFARNPASIYAVTCRSRKMGRPSRLDTWAYPLAVGQPLPSLPIWLSDDQSVSLELEASYEETCRSLRIM